MCVAELLRIPTGGNPLGSSLRIQVNKHASLLNSTLQDTSQYRLGLHLFGVNQHHNRQESHVPFRPSTPLLLAHSYSPGVGGLVDTSDGAYSLRPPSIFSRSANIGRSRFGAVASVPIPPRSRPGAPPLAYPRPRLDLVGTTGSLGGVCINMGTFAC